MPGAKNETLQDSKLKASDHDIYGVATIVSLLIPLAGIVLGIIYLAKVTKLDRKLGEHLIAVGIFSSLIYGILFFIYGGNLVANPFVPTNTALTTQSVIAPTTQASAWDVNSQYVKIKEGMTKQEVESAIQKTASNCSTGEQSSSSDKYATCIYGGSPADDGIIVVNYKNNLVTTTEKSTF